MKPQSLQAAIATVDLDMLRSFVAIVESGSMTKAARLVYRTPAAVSLQIKKLEELLGVRLMERTSRATHLTSHGELLMNYARQLLSINQELFGQFNQSQPVQTLTFGLAEQFGVTDLPAVLSQFSKAYPHIRVEVVVGRSTEIMQKFLRKELDIGLVNLLTDSPPEYMQLVSKERLCWATVSGSSIAQQMPLKLSLAETGCAWRQLAVEALSKQGLDYTIAYTSDSYMGQVAAAKADLAIAAIPFSLLEAPLIEVDRAAGLPDIGIVPTYVLQHPAQRGVEDADGSLVAGSSEESLVDSYKTTLSNYIKRVFSRE
ncbi:MAG: LysR family transcriptional regulator [Alteromonadaceae bacterium]|nr:LysR family transcriptional regulator [Alteromonadaceae bacterium]